MAFVMRTKSYIIRWVWLIVFAGVSVVFISSRADGNPLTQADIEMVMSVRNTADTLREEALMQAARSRAGKEKSFPDLMIEVQRIGQEADERACRHHGVQVSEYRQKLRRIVNVSDLVALETVKGELQEELQKRQSMSEADLQAEAERQRASTEEWFHQFEAKRSPDTTTGTKRATPSDDVTRGTIKRALPEGYMDSLDQTVMKPMRQQVASGEWAESVRQANKHCIEEIRRQISKINVQLAAPAMRQAAADKSVVLAVLDAKTLQELRASLIEDK